MNPPESVRYPKGAGSAQSAVEIGWHHTNLQSVQYQICHSGGNSLARCCGMYPRITASRRLTCWLGHPTWAHREPECFPNIVRYPTLPRSSKLSTAAPRSWASVSHLQRVIDSESDFVRRIEMIVHRTALLSFTLRRRRITTPSIKAGLHPQRAVTQIYSCVSSKSTRVSDETLAADARRVRASVGGSGPPWQR